MPSAIATSECQPRQQLAHSRAVAAEENCPLDDLRTEQRLGRLAVLGVGCDRCADEVGIGGIADGNAFDAFGERGSGRCFRVR